MSIKFEFTVNSAELYTALAHFITFESRSFIFEMENNEPYAGIVEYGSGRRSEAPDSLKGDIVPTNAHSLIIPVFSKYISKGISPGRKSTGGGSRKPGRKKGARSGS